MSTPTSPHDHFFKESFSRPDAAADLLQCALPAHVIGALDLATLRTTKGSFVTPNLREHHTDLLFEVVGRDGSPALIYLLMEYKSSPERWVALDMLRYASDIWRDWLKKQTERGVPWPKQLPPIIPLVLYHGTDRWTAPADVAELIHTPAALARYRPHLRHELLDLSKVTDETLPVGIVSRVALLALKYIFRPEISERVVEIVATLNKLNECPGRLAYIRTVLDYLIIAAYELNAERLRQVVKEEFHEGDRVMPTIAEQWLQQGIQQGIQTGLHQGRHQEANLLVERLLRRRFGLLPQWAVNRLAMATAEDLEQYGERLLDATTLESVFHESGTAVTD